MVELVRREQARYMLVAKLMAVEARLSYRKIDSFLSKA